MNLRDQLVICGAAELAPLLEQGDIGAVVTASFSDLSDIKEGPRAKLLELIKAKGIYHFRTGLFCPWMGLDEASWIPQEEFEALQVLEVHNALDQIDALRTKIGDRKLVIHCLHGSDRSAMLGLVALVRDRGGIAHVDRALGDLYRIRPRAGLTDVVHFFRAYFGGDYPAFQAAVAAYRNGMFFLQRTRDERRAIGGVCPRQRERRKAGVIGDRVRRYNAFTAPRFGLPSILLCGPG